MSLLSNHGCKMAEDTPSLSSLAIQTPATISVLLAPHPPHNCTKCGAEMLSWRDRQPPTTSCYVCLGDCKLCSKPVPWQRCTHSVYCKVQGFRLLPVVWIRDWHVWRILDASAIHSYLNEIHPSAPLALTEPWQALTVSSPFMGTWKRESEAHQTDVRKPKIVDFLSQIGRIFEVDESFISKSEEYVFSKYGKNLKHLNEAREALFKHMDDTLPPNWTKTPWKSIFLG